MRKASFWAVMALFAALVACGRSKTEIKSFMLQWQSSSGSSPQAGFIFDTSTQDTVGYVVGTGADTSKVFPIHPYQAAAISAQDTSSGGTAVNLRLYLYGASGTQFNYGIPTFPRFALLDSFDITAETSHDLPWVFQNYGPYQLGFIRAVGQTGNASTAVEVKVVISYDERL